VSVDGVSQAVVIVEADKVRAALQKLGAGPAASGSDYASKSLGTMKWIPAGTFTMGSPSSESGRSDDETQHSVTLTKGYWLMEHEVTQGEWQAVMGSNPSKFTACGPKCPVEQVSWGDAVAFAKKASARDGVTYKLPTEAQWEYAARGGQATGQQTLYSGSNEATSVGWIDANSGKTTHAVCGKVRNGYGLCDMTGNVQEWISDWYREYGGSATDPTGAFYGVDRVFEGGAWHYSGSSASDRVLRGGSWDNSAQYARVAVRNGVVPASRYGNLGFRLSRTGP
jgi:formylglycine-generating enzyme required for sulfatase activity